MGHKLVCLNCRESQNIDSDLTKCENLNKFCLNCCSKLILLPHRFRPPKKSDLKKWEVVRYLFENGFTYEHFYDDENQKYFKIPETLYEAKEFIEIYKQFK